MIDYLIQNFDFYLFKSRRKSRARYLQWVQWNILWLIDFETSLEKSTQPGEAGISVHRMREEIHAQVPIGQTYHTTSWRNQQQIIRSKRKRFRLGFGWQWCAILSRHGPWKQCLAGIWRQFSAFHYTDWATTEFERFSPTQTSSRWTKSWFGYCEWLARIARKCNWDQVTQRQATVGNSFVGFHSRDDFGNNASSRSNWNENGHQRIGWQERTGNLKQKSRKIIVWTEFYNNVSGRGAIDFIFTYLRIGIYTFVTHLFDLKLKMELNIS